MLSESNWISIAWFFRSKNQFSFYKIKFILNDKTWFPNAVSPVIFFSNTYFLCGDVHIIYKELCILLKIFLFLKYNSWNKPHASCHDDVWYFKTDLFSIIKTCIMINPLSYTSFLNGLF